MWTLNNSNFSKVIILPVVNAVAVEIVVAACAAVVETAVAAEFAAGSSSSGFVLIFISLQFWFFLIMED